MVFSSIFQGESNKVGFKKLIQNYLLLWLKVVGKVIDILDNGGGDVNKGGG